MSLSGEQSRASRTSWPLIMLVVCASVPAASADSGAGARPGDDLMLAQTQSLDQLFESTPKTPSPDSGAPPAQAPAQAPSADSLFEPPAKPASEAGLPDSGTTSTDSLTTLQPMIPGSQAFSFKGFLQHELAYTYPSPDHFSKLKNTADLIVDGTLDNGIAWRLGGRLSYDPIYDMTNFYPEPVRDDQTFEAQVREAYIDFSRGDLEFRVGRQHVIWGEVVGAFVADVVSAKDLREIIVQDFDLLRIPQWAARAEYFRGDFVGELLWIPYMTVNDIGKPGADFFPFPPISPGFIPVFRADENPALALSHSAVGARGSYLVGGWDTSLFYFTSMDQNAAFRRQLIPGPQPTLVYTPVHERIHQVGATVTKDVGAALVKLEAVYTVDRLLPVTALGDADGLARQNVLDYLVGVEWAFRNDTRLNLQFLQRWHSKHVSSMVPDELESAFSVYLSTRAFDTDVKPSLLWIQSLNRSDWLLEAKLTWEFRPGWRAVVGADIFGGPPDGLFGQYDDNDRIYYELRYSF